MGLEVIEMRLIDADAIDYELWTTEVDVSNKRENYCYYQNRFMVDKRDIESMPTVNQWIPCKERLPVAYVQVLVCQLCEDPPFIAYINSEGDWRADSPYVNEGYEPIAWMPLPKPYIERKTDERY